MKSSTSIRRKVCVIGLDGVGLRNLRNMLGVLPLNGINRVVSKGFVSSFISLPPYTPCAWTSIFTGVNPGKHGIYGFYKVSRNGRITVNVSTSYDVKYPRIFEILGMSGLKSVVINVPLVYPVHELVSLKNLVVVSDWASPKQFIYPKQDEDRYREYLVEPPHKWASAVNVNSYVKAVEAFLEKRIDLYYELLEKENYNLFIIVFSELDWLMHRIPDIVMGKQMNLVYKVLALIDKFIGRVCEVCDLIVLVSDHGFTISRLFIGVNSILARNGLMMSSYKLNIDKLFHRQQPKKCDVGGKQGFNYITSRIIRNLFEVISVVTRKIVSSQALNKLEAIVPISTEIDYSSSKAIMLEPANWGIYVKEGYVDLVKKLFSNNRFVKKVLHREELFWGPHTQEAPDLILVPRDHVFFDARIHAEPMYLDYVSEHEPHAMIAFYGDYVLPATSMDNPINVSIYDLVPTILAYIGLPIPRDSDGKPRIEVFNVGFYNKKYDYLEKFKMLRKIKQLKIGKGGKVKS